jgi:hypothetical protein
VKQLVEEIYSLAWYGENVSENGYFLYFVLHSKSYCGFPTRGMKGRGIFPVKKIELKPHVA